MLHKQAHGPVSTIPAIEFTDCLQIRVVHLRNQMGQVWSEAVSASTSSRFVTAMPARNAAGSSHSSRHASIFSVRPFSAPPTDGQLPVTFPAEALPKQQAQKLTFLNAADIPRRPARAGGVEATSPSPGVSPAEVVQGVTARQTDEGTCVSARAMVQK